jgi:hypothetical protein
MYVDTLTCWVLYYRALSESLFVYIYLFIFYAFACCTRWDVSLFVLFAKYARTHYIMEGRLYILYSVVARDV